MTKIQSLLLALLAVPFGLQAETLSPSEALQRAQGMQTRAGVEMKLVKTFTSEKGMPTVYAFNSENRGGYMLVSADNVAYPLLGYSDSGSLDESNMSPSFKWWISEYSRQIEWAVANGAKPLEAAYKAPSGAEILPLIKTQWDQGSPYNGQCPEVNGRRCVTGCVATAMAQVMKYWEYPKVGEGIVSADNPAGGSSLTLNLAEKPFDWANMLDVYESGAYDQTQADAVAYLMKACGYSVEMSYSPNESGAMSTMMGSALINNFGYNPYMSYESRDNYTLEQWQQMIYDELAAKRPVLYDGSSESSGHQFICDGYRGDGYYHFNWGWSGSSDGYYLLTSLDPNTLGTGGGLGGGYNFDQDICVGVQPTAEGSAGKLTLQQTGTITGNKLSTSNITVKLNGDNTGWFNLNFQTINIFMGVIIEGTGDVAGQNAEVAVGNASSLAPGYGYTSFKFGFPTSLPNGKYKVTVATKDATSPSATWVPVKSPISSPNYFYATKKNSAFTLEFEAMKVCEITNSELLTPLYVDKAAKLKFTVSNTTDVELSQTIAPALVKDGVIYYVGSGIPMTVMPGESATRECITEFIAQDVEVPVLLPAKFTLQFVNLDNSSLYSYVGPEVELSNYAGAVLSIKNFEVKNCEKGQLSNGAIVYIVTDPKNIQVSAEIECVEGYFGQDIYTYVFNANDGSGIGYDIMSPCPTISAGQTVTIDCNYSFEDAVLDQIYLFSLTYADGNQLKFLEDFLPESEQDSNICYFVVQDPAGVDKLVSDNALQILYNRAGASVSVTSEAGVRSVSVMTVAGMAVDAEVAISGNEATANLSQLPRGVYVLTATDNDGNVRTLKIAK